LSLRFSTRPRDTGLDLNTLNEFFRLLGATGPRTLRALRHFAAQRYPRRVYLHEMPGRTVHQPQRAGSLDGDIAPLAGNRPQPYSAVNQLFGDIVKVTPSSKVVGDMALFLFTRGVNLPTS